MLPVALTSFFNELLSSYPIAQKCSRFLKDILGIFQIFRKHTRNNEKSNNLDMADSEVIWFDGVDKKLIEMHSKTTTLKAGNDQTLKTKEPLPSISSYTNKRKRNNSVHQSTSDNRLQSAHKLKKLSTEMKVKPNQNDIIKPNTGITDELAMDCEMVECYHNTSVLARVSIVNLFGHPILDRYVAPPAPITDYRTKWSGIRRSDLINAPSFEQVQAEVADMIKNRIVIGHALHNDFAVLKLQHPPDKVRDTSLYFKYLFQGKSPSLKKLCECVLGIKIQKGEHDSVQDAQAAMKLYVKERDKWNEKLPKQNQQQTHNNNNHHHHQKTKPKKKKMKTFYVLTT